jgi:hypothetical protein
LLLVELVRDASDSVESAVMRDIFRFGNSRQRLIMHPTRSEMRRLEVTAARHKPLLDGHHSTYFSLVNFLHMKDIVFLLALVAGAWALKYQTPPGNVRGRTFSLQAANVPENAKILQRSDLGIRDISNSLELWDYWDLSTHQVD